MQAVPRLRSNDSVLSRELLMNGANPAKMRDRLPLLPDSSTRAGVPNYSNNYLMLTGRAELSAVPVAVVVIAPCLVGANVDAGCKEDAGGSKDKERLEVLSEDMHMVLFFEYLAAVRASAEQKPG